MYRKLLFGSTVAFLLAFGLACSNQSPNPTSPSSTAPAGAPAAGPGGSTLKATAPTVVSPSGNEEIDTQTPTLWADNASGRYGTGSFVYRFELSDASGTVIREGTVVAGTDRTGFPITDPLPAPASFTWRVRAEQDGFVGPWSDTASFGTLEPVTVDTPIPVSPVGGVTVDSNRPDFAVTNGGFSGPAGQILYRFQVAADLDFSTMVASGTTERSTGTTTVHDVGTLPWNQVFYWRVWATATRATSAFSAAQTFRTPEETFIDAPTPLSPIGGATATSRTPTLTVTNGTVRGNVGQVTYVFEVSTQQTFGAVTATGQQALGPVTATGRATRSSGSTTSASVGPLAETTTFFWRAYGTNGTITGPSSAVHSFVTPRGGPRPPDPPAGQRLPRPNMAHIVAEIAARYPGDLRNSCQEHGGNWNFMDKLVDRLREFDTRWAYNWKRGNIGDPSLDVVDYHWGPGPDENSTEVYIIDVIGGHCGPAPGPIWFDVTQVTKDNNTIGRWTSRGRFK